MKYYRFNQIAMAVLGALLLIFGTRTIMQIAFEEHEPEKPGMEVTKKDEAKPGAEDAAGGETELAALLAKGDVAKGETAAAVCKACHAFDAGAASPIGPNLHNVVGRKIASVEGFNYSPALKEKSGEEWTYENLDKMIHNPGQFAPGTIMAFPGLPDAQQRADVILFLRSKTDNPPPLPEAASVAAAAPEGAAPTEEAAEAPAGDKNAEVGTLVSKADPAKGEQAAAVCKACHTFDKDAPSPIGPNLYGVVGRKIASVEGFNYSPALKEKSGEAWDYAYLDAMIHNPMQYAPGTLMAFPGVPDASQRADVIAFLRTKADTPFPLPEEGAAAPAEKEKPAEEAPPAAEEEQPAEEAPPGTEEEQPAEEAPPATDEEQPAEAPPAAEAAPAEPAEEAPPAAEEEKPAEAPPAAEEEAPAETPAPPPEAPAAEEKPAAETPDVPEADMTPPSTETQPQPVVPEEMEEAPAPAAEPAPAEEPSGAPSEAAPSGDDNLSSQPQPVYPEGAPDAAAPTTPEEAPAPSADEHLSSQPQPVYPEGEPPSATSTSEASGATPSPADLSSQPQPVYPEGPPQ